MAMIDAVVTRAERDFERSVENLKTLLRFASVGTDPAHDADTLACARWLEAQFAGMGMEASVRPTAGQPMVVASDLSAGPDKPTVLYYGHYDVQPADPLELWTSPPFEPVIKEGPRGPWIVARGAVDDKGQITTWIEALRAWKAEAGALPVNVKVFIEGEEESGSKSLEPFLEAAKDDLAADVCVISDTGMPGLDKPAITYMLRGLVYVEVTLHGPSADLHSGKYGGAVVNPINALCELITKLHDADRRVQIPGFYDDVRAIEPTELESWKAIGVESEAMLADIGLSTSQGEKGYSILERVWSRPCCDVNGIWGGYTGEGSKTVIASHASAKISCRLVPDQDPAKVLDGLRQFFEQHKAADCRVEITDLGSGLPIRVPTTSPFLQAAHASLEEVFGTKASLIAMGGSIPAVASINRILGLDSLMVGFSLDDDRVHSPNEKFDLECLRRGIKTHATMLGRFAEL